MRISRLYNFVVQPTLFAALFAFLLIYIVGGLWLFPFNFLLPQHFDNFVATTLTGRFIERIGFLWSFLAAFGFIRLYCADLRSVLPAMKSSLTDKIKLFLKTALITFVCLAGVYLVALYWELVSLNADGNHPVITDFYSSLYSLLVLGVAGHFLVAVGEETVYRGVVFRYLLKTTDSKNIALVVSALIFSLFHFHYSAPLSFLVAFIGGYFLALLYHQSCSLLVCISVHWTYNVFMHLFTPNYKTYIVDYFDLSLQPLPGWGSYFALLRICAFAIGILFLLKRNLKYNMAYAEISSEASANG